MDKSSLDAARAPRGGPPWRLLAAACALVLIIAMLLPRSKPPAPAASAATNAPQPAVPVNQDNAERLAALRARTHFGAKSADGKTAEQTVASLVRKLSRRRRHLVEEIARKLGQPVPPEIERFFDAIDSGDWDAIHSQFHELAIKSGQYDYSNKPDPSIGPYWEAVLDSYGVAEQAHLWPAQSLLDYGRSVLDSLKPGMAYVGGTDNGRWVPELVNEEGDGDHVMLTQNAFADSRYLDYLTAQYGSQMNTLTQDDSQKAFQDYIADAQKRLQHDRDFPDEPKQVLAGEDIDDGNGGVRVSGQTAVMEINQRLLEMLMQKNPNLAFGLQESFPFKDTYAGAVPLGPLMELNGDSQSGFTSDAAAQSATYWQNVAQNALADPEISGSDTALKSYSKDATSAANLLAAHQFNDQAAQTYQLAIQLWPDSPEANYGYANILAATGHPDQARQWMDNFHKNHPDTSIAPSKTH